MLMSGTPDIYQVLEHAIETAHTSGRESPTKMLFGCVNLIQTAPFKFYIQAASAFVWVC